MAARAHGLAILDGVFNEIADAEGLARQCAQARGLRLRRQEPDPSQPGGAPPTPPSRPTPTRSPGRARWWRAFEQPENAGKGVLKVEGRMVERLHLAEAQRLIGVAEAIAAREAA